MTSERRVLLKKGREKPLLNRHHWIFSGAVQSLPNIEPGEILPVYSWKKELLGSAYFNPKSSILGRMLSFGKTPPLESLFSNMKNSISLRKRFFDEQHTNTYRLINGEGDNIPGLIIDKYANTLVIQISTLGIERLKNKILSFLLENFPSNLTIYEKSLLPSRKEEGLPAQEGFLHGKENFEVEVFENNIHFIVSLTNSQKTGLFLDQREMRKLICTLSKNKRVLNAFSYTGGFSLYAAKGYAKEITSLDISKQALETAKRNFQLNNLPSSKNSFICKDAFQFLRENPLPYDIIILDPPAFAKKKGDIKKACRGYKDINRLTMQKMPENSLLLTCSCSYYVDEKLFQTVLFQAAAESQRRIQILEQHKQAYDHPINLYHPEGKYLKSFLLYLT